MVSVWLGEEEDLSVLCRPGDDLLSRVLRQSTIGAEAFDGRVRDGIGSDRLAKATRPAKDAYGGREERRLGPEGLLRRSFRDPVEAKLVLVERLGARRRRRPVGRQARRAVLIDDALAASVDKDAHWQMRTIKSNERLVPVSCTHCCASTPGLSTWWSSTALQGEMVLRLVSRLDAFSGYPFRT